ncbi:unnamed protein product [Macrosiphum euphorbiae]|uniref:Retropepsins domain-containing protein n=1 Tax=Macrosiphum euphorbiae TaxID=13131 RepID=A0AAV0Y8E1_9HEMI|nr:unnamed protein product [Macrosiphum euphorbiae]
MSVITSLEAAFRILPKFDKQDSGGLHNFIKSSEFAFLCISEDIKPKILGAIIANLTAKAAQVVRFKKIDTWEELNIYILPVGYGYYIYTSLPGYIYYNRICQATEFINRKSKFLLDTGSEVNIIKLLSLKDDVKVNERILYRLKGINEYFVNTIGSVNITVNFEEEKRQVRFQVVSNNFPIPHDGILGKEFLVDNTIAIDYAKNEITSTLTEDNITVVNQDSPHVD